MPDERSSTDVEKLIADETVLDDRKQALVAAILKQKEPAIRGFDEKLEKHGYEVNAGRRKRSHHKRTDVAGSTSDVKPVRSR
jgi:hypothetical protein